MKSFFIQKRTLLLGIFFSLPSLADNTVNDIALASCAQMKAIQAYFFSSESDLPKTPTIKSPYVIVGTMLGAMKIMNDQVFGGATLKTQVVAELFHALIFDQLRKEPRGNKANLVLAQTKVPFPKEMHMALYISNPLGLNLVAEIFENAHSNAVKIFTQLLKNPMNPPIEIEPYLNYQPIRDQFFTISFGGSPAISVTPFELRDIIVPDLVKYFGSVEKFTQWLAEKYKLGVGPTRAGATFAARSIGEDAGRVVEIGTIQRFIVSFREVFKHYKRISSLVDQESFALALFSNARKYKTVTDMPPNYRSMLQQIARLLSLPLRDANAFLQHYIQQLNIFDALKPHYIFSNPQAEKKFDETTGSGIVLHIDIRNLGAKGYLSIQNKLPKFQSIIDRLTEFAVMRERLSSNETGVDRIDKTMVDLVSQLALIHQNSLEDANFYLTERFSSINSILDGLKKNGVILDYVFWKSGDDAYYKIFSDRLKIHDDILSALIAHSNLNSTIRVVGRPMSGTYLLAEARQDLAFLLDQVKAEEVSGVNNYLFQTSSDDQPQIYSVD